jgi:hypothetical protein
MSELSRSLHLRSGDIEAATRLLLDARVAGFVWPPTNGWVPLVWASEEGTAPRRTDLALSRIVARNTGLLLDYKYAADQGFDINVYDGQQCSARFKYSFEDGSGVFDRTAMIRLGLLTKERADVISAWVRDGSEEEDEGPGAKLIVPEQLGLVRYRWQSYRDESSRLAAKGQELLSSGRVAVDAAGNVRTTEQQMADAIENFLRDVDRPTSPRRRGTKTVPSAVTGKTRGSRGR